VVLGLRAAPRRERAYGSPGAPPLRDRGQEPPDQRSGFARRVALPALSALGRALSAVTPGGVVRKARARLDMAGNPRGLGVTEYLGLRVLSPAVVVPLGMLALRAADLRGPVWWLAAAVVIGVGLWLPEIVLQRVIEARQLAIRRALPDILDLLVVAVEAGIGFDQALAKVIQKYRGPLAEELARVLEQVRLGKSRSEALRAMAERTQVADLGAFVAAVQQADTLGVSIANTLRIQADAARERRSQHAREAAAKLPVKLLFPLVFLIFPALFVVVLGPGAIRFAEVFKAWGK
jgi:tight adherence protein C